MKCCCCCCWFGNVKYCSSKQYVLLLRTAVFNSVPGIIVFSILQQVVHLHDQPQEVSRSYRHLFLRYIAGQQLQGL